MRKTVNPFRWRERDRYSLTQATLVFMSDTVVAKADLFMIVVVCLPIAARRTRRSGFLDWP
jgi:hypothetical protein